jgi:hypothetical protein
VEKRPKKPANEFTATAQHAFFEQPQFERLLGNNFQVLRLAPELLDFIGRRRTCGVAWCFRVARRMSRTRFSDLTGVELDFCLIFAPWGLR